ARPIRPDDTAAKRSADARSKPVDAAMGSPSEDTTTASCTPGTRSTKLLISQLMLLAAWLICLTCSSNSRAFRSLRSGLVVDAAAAQTGAVPRQHLADLLGRALGRRDRRRRR